MGKTSFSSSATQSLSSSSSSSTFRRELEGARKNPSSSSSSSATKREVEEGKKNLGEPGVKNSKEVNVSSKRSSSEDSESDKENKTKNKDVHIIDVPQGSPNMNHYRSSSNDCCDCDEDAKIKLFGSCLGLFCIIAIILVSGFAFGNWSPDID